MLVHEAGGARLTIALAGHPPPLLIRSDGAVEQVGRSGTVLGVIDPVSIDSASMRAKSRWAPGRLC
jgi:serine phosphatase RsbU (regulator of sigma subunit)